MSTHPEPPIEPAADHGAMKRSPWTSLEVAKFVASLATPFALFTLSYLLNEQQAQLESHQKRQEEMATARQKHEESVAAAAARANRLLAEKAALKRDDDIRQQNRLFQTELQRVALDREKDLQDEAFRRDESVRRQQLELARFQKLAEKRIEFWEKLAPKLDQIDMVIDNVLLRKQSQEEVLGLFRDCENLFGLYKPYFSPKFVEDYLTYKKWTLDFIKLVNGPVVLGLAAPDGASAACQNYVNLRNSAAYEVAEATGLLDRASGERSYQSVFVDCEKRSEEVLARVIEMEHPSQAQ